MGTEENRIIAMIAHKAIISAREVAAAGIDTKTLTRMVGEGTIRRVARGLYSAADYEPTENYSILEASRIVRRGVICLMSALAYHEIGTQSPTEVWIAIPRGSRAPSVSSHPIHVVHFSRETHEAGQEYKQIEGEEVVVYSIAKTLADCFKYRNKIGLDVAIEALRDVLDRQLAPVDEILRCADVCRVRRIMTPYLESLA